MHRAEHAFPARVDRGVVLAVEQAGVGGPDPEQDHDAVVAEPSQDEDQGADREVVGPLHVVDDHQQRIVAADGAERGEEVGAHHHRVGAGIARGPGERVLREQVGGQGGGELVDDAVGERRLRLVTRGGQQVHRTGTGDRAREQGRLAHPRRSGDPADPRFAAARRRDGPVDRRQLGPATDERPAGRQCLTSVH